MTTEQKFEAGWKLMMEACKEGDYGDPFSYARSREIFMAIKLGHKVAPTLSGADGFDSEGECEYKSTINDFIHATYNGISVFDTWEEQVHYLIKEKIKKYKNHYFARFTTDLSNPIAEVWRMNGDNVYKLLLPKLKKKYLKENKGKDPRLGASLSKKEIYEYAERIF
jgi:hypothetical protein